MIKIGKQIEDKTISDPVEHLSACHRRIEARLDTIERAVKELQTRPEEAAAALRSALRFLDTSGHLHTRDEEESIFPRMLARLDEQGRAYLAELERQHLAAEKLHNELKATIEELALPIDPLQLEALSALASRFCAAYRAHIRSEDSHLIELARQTLRDDERQPIVSEMRARRNH